MACPARRARRWQRTNSLAGGRSIRPARHRYEPAAWPPPADGASEGLDADAAIHGAAERLAAKVAQDPIDDYRYTTDALIAESTDQRHASDRAGLGATTFVQKLPSSKGSTSRQPPAVWERGFTLCANGAGILVCHPRQVMRQRRLARARLAVHH